MKARKCHRMFPVSVLKWWFWGPSFVSFLSFYLCQEIEYESCHVFCSSPLKRFDKKNVSIWECKYLNTQSFNTVCLFLYQLSDCVLFPSWPGLLCKRGIQPHCHVPFSVKVKQENKLNEGTFKEITHPHHTLSLSACQYSRTTAEQLSEQLQVLKESRADAQVQFVTHSHSQVALSAGTWAALIVYQTEGLQVAQPAG